MPTINFPLSPALNDTYSFGGKTWVYNGTGWELTGSASESRAALDVPSKAEMTQAIASSRNILLNGNMLISQEFGTASTTITAGAVLKYVVDGWYVATPAGGNLTAQQVITNNKASLVITGSAGNTGVILGSRVESADSYSMAGLFATLSLIISSSSLTSVTWSLYYASTKDTFGTIASPTRNLIDTGTLSGITSTATLKSAITNAALSASAHTGLELVITTGALLGSQTLTVESAKLEKGAIAAPVIDAESYQAAIAKCERLFRVVRGGVGMSTGNIATFGLSHPNMRVAPTPTVSAALQVAQPGIGAFTQSSGAIVISSGNNTDGGDYNCGNFTGMTVNVPLLLKQTGGKIFLNARL